MNKYKNISKEILQDIVVKYQEGASALQISKLYGFSDSYIRTLIKRQGINLRPYLPKLSEELIHNIINMYADGYSSIVVARKFNINDCTVIDYARKYGIPIRTTTHWKAPKLNNKDTQKIILKEYSNPKTSITKISNEINVSQLTISKFLKSNNIYIENKNRKWWINKDFFKGDSWQLAYLYGFCLGDGCLYIKNNINRMQFAIHANDSIILKQFCHWINIPEEAIKYYTNKSHLILDDEIFKEDYSQFGLVANKTYNGVRPKDFDLHFLKPFIIGLIDADGTIRINKNKTKYTRFGLTCSKIVIEWFIDSLRRLGYDGEIKIENPSDKSWARALIYRHENITNIINLLEPQLYFHLTRKWDQL